MCERQPGDVALALLEIKNLRCRSQLEFEIPVRQFDTFGISCRPARVDQRTGIVSRKRLDPTVQDRIVQSISHRVEF